MNAPVLKAIATALACVQQWYGRQITIQTSNQAVLQAMRNPMQQSGQESLHAIYSSINTMEEQGNRVTGQWTPNRSEFRLRSTAKAAAKEATKQGQQVNGEQRQAKAAIVRALLSRHGHPKTLPEGVGRFSKEVDKALPGRHTKTLRRV